MKKITSLLLVALSAMLTVNAQELLDEEVYGFEVSEYILIQNADYITITDEKAAVGDSSLKVHCDDYSANADAWQIQIGSAATAPDSAKIIVPAGDYYIVLDAYCTGDAPLKFNTNINTPWKAVNWDITNIEKDKWVSLQQKITLEETNSKMSIKITAGQRPTSGSGTLFIDNIRLIKDEYVMDTIEGNFLDEYYYGFEAGTEANIDGVFIPTTSDPYVSFETEKNPNMMSNKYALKFDVPSLVDLPLKANGKTNNFSIQIGSKDELLGAGSAIVPAGDYTASIKVFVDEYNIKAFTTPFNDNEATPKDEKDEWLNIVWSIPSTITTGEWVTLSQKITLAMDYDTKLTIKMDQKDLVDSAKNAVIFFDDIAFVEYAEDTTSTDTISDDGYKVDNVLNETFLGFEQGTIGWYPQKNAGEGYFFFPTDKAATGAYSLLLEIPAAATDVPDNIKLQAKIADGNTIELDGGVYDLYMKVWIDENTTISSLNTNFNKDEIGAFKAVQWDLTNVEKGQWVEIHRVDTLPSYSASKIVIQTKSDSIDFSTNACKIYVDDIAAVYKEAYIPMPGLKANAALEDSVFAIENPAIHFSVENFILGTEGKISYTLNDGTAMMHESTDSIQLSTLTNGEYVMVLELTDMDGASLDPQVTDTLNFSVELPASLKDRNSITLDVYPNPAQNYIFVNAEVGSSINIYNLLGATVKTTTQVSEKTRVDISNLDSGTYLIRINNKNGSAVSKLQIN